MDNGLAEHQEDHRAASTSAPDRRRGIALGLLGLVVLALGLGVVFADQYRRANDVPASGTIVDIQRRTLSVVFTDASGTRLVADVHPSAREPSPRVGDRRDIVYLPGVYSDGRVSAWDASTPPMGAFPWIIAVVGLGVLAVAALEFSGRAPWKDAVTLDERSIGQPR
ncbi:hypothetical protein [Herbidospora sp. RD11066]